MIETIVRLCQQCNSVLRQAEKGGGGDLKERELDEDQREGTYFPPRTSSKTTCSAQRYITFRGRGDLKGRAKG